MSDLGTTSFSAGGGPADDLKQCWYFRPVSEPELTDEVENGVPGDGGGQHGQVPILDSVKCPEKVKVKYANCEAWRRPCLCRGSTKWVHEACLERWVDEKQQGDAYTQVRCAQCNTLYNIKYPGMGVLGYVLDRLDKLLERATPAAAVAGLLTAAWWSAVTYGALTVVQVFGYTAGMRRLRATHPLLLCVSLPTVPVILLMHQITLNNSVHTIATGLFRMRLKYSPGRWQLPERLDADQELGERADVVAARPQPAHMRDLCVALAGPTCALLLGRMCFPQEHNAWKRTLNGASVYSLATTGLRVYYRYKQMERRTRRKILDYPDG